jgi:hypothetical protein
MASAAFAGIPESVSAPPAPVVKASEVAKLRCRNFIFRLSLVGENGFNTTSSASAILQQHGAEQLVGKLRACVLIAGAAANDG